MAGSVSRETPPIARELFGEQLARAQQYADLLVGAGVERGLIGPQEAGRIWQRHLLNCAVVAPRVRSGSTVCDLGSGAGLPGIVVALLRPDVTMTLLEPQLRRIRFLEEAVALLGLETVEVRRGRAEEVVGDLVVDVVLARAVAPLGRLVGWAVPLLRPGGEVLAMKGESAAAEVAAAETALRAAGATAAEVETLGAGTLESPTYLVRIVAGPVGGAAARPPDRRRGRGR